jgi:predicted nucleic acid-binding protein
LAFLIDTDIAIHLRDDEPDIVARLASLAGRPELSILTQVELEGGMAREPRFTVQRRAALDDLLSSLRIHNFDADCAVAYRRILEQCGYSRPRVVDRMIAATALANDLPLITINGADFRDIPGLKLEIWPSPAVQ